MNYRLLVSVALILAVSSSSAQKKSSATAAPNMLTAAEKKDGWMLLFNGQSTTGWHSYGKPAAGPSWKTGGGAVYYDTANEKTLHDRDLVTDKEYENFHLKYEWKIAPKGNSGLLFDVNEDTALYKQTYFTGPEMQIIDNNGHADAKNPRHRAGDLYDLIAVSQETVKPVEEFNQAEIILNKGKLDLFLNGVNVVSTTMWDDNWNQLAAKSKFKSMAGFAKTKKGRIALQSHGSMVWFRNMKIKEL